MKLVTVTGYKGGVGKSTTAVHLATFFSERGKTVLVDADPNRTALQWASRGKLPFAVADERQAMKAIATAEYVVFDTPARPHSRANAYSESRHDFRNKQGSIRSYCE